MSDLAVDLLGQLRQAFGNPLFSAGERLFEAGGVQDVRVLQSGKVVTGVAAPGAPGVKWRVYIQYQSPHAAAEQVAGECGCGEPAPCVHVAAVCIAAAKQVRVAAVDPSSARAAALPQRSQHSFAQGFTQQHRLYYRFERATFDDVDGAECSTLLLTLWIALPAPDPACIQPGSATRFEPRSFLAEGHFPRYVDSDDQRIIKALTTRRFISEWVLREEAGELLPQAIATGRAFWASLQDRALRLGAPRRMQFSWRVRSDGVQRLGCDSPGRLVLLLEPEPALYIDVATCECGTIELACPLPVLRDYWNRDFAPAAIAAANAQLATAGLLPPLRCIVVQPQPLVSVRARLRLTAAPARELQYLYNDLPVERWLAPYDPTVRVMPDRDAELVYEFERDQSAEARLRARLAQVVGEFECNTKQQAWLLFMMQGVPALQADGWEVVIDEHFPFRIAATQEWYAELRTDRDDVASGWFDLRLGVTVEDQSCNLLPALVKYLQCADALGPAAPSEDAEYQRIDDWLLMRLEDGRYLPVPMARIQRIAETLVELFDRNSLNRRQALSLPASQASRMLLLDMELPRLRCDDGYLSRLMEDLRSSSITPLRPPEGFPATLRHYQQEGLGWLQFLRRCRLGGILADDMGLGKTIQTLAHLVLEKQRRAERQASSKPSLIVAPVSVIGNWQQEMRRFAPALKLVVLHGNRRRESFAAVAGCDVVVTGYPQLQLDSDFLLSCEFELVVFDEAQMIKNPRTRVAQVARALKAEQRLCLTGTPMENHLGELWSLLDFLQPGLLGDERQFQRLYRTPIEKEGNLQRAAALSRRIAPFVLRRTKDAVATELPDKTQIVESIVLDERQRDFYDAIRLAMHQRVQEVIEQQGLARSRITMLDALLKLRQACCDPRLVDLDLGLDTEPRANIPSAKLQWLMTVLAELAAEGRRVLLFSQFTSMLSLIETAVQEASIPYCLLTGATRQRSAQVEKFQAGEVPLFLISLKAGGTGLNLTAADTVIHYDPWWNPAVEAQATDRAHRIGQRQPVFVYKLIAQDTVEEKILRLQADKHALANQLYTRQTPLTQLSAADLAELLAP